MRARPRSSRTEGALRCRPCRAGPPSPDRWLGSEAENDREGGTRATAVAREEAPRVLAGRGHLEQPAQERVAVRRGRPLELHPLAHGGQVGAAHAGGRAEPGAAGPATGGSGRRGGGGRSRCRPDPRRADRVDGAATGVETDMVGFCLSRRGRAPRRTLSAVTRVTAATRRVEWTRVTSL